MKIACIAIFLVLLGGCTTSGYQKFYSPYVNASSLPDVELLKDGQAPQVFGSDNFQRDIRIMRAKNYVPVGYSSFNGGYEDKENAIAQAKRIGATLVIINSQYTDTQTTTSALFLPDNKTTYHSGTAYGTTSYSNNYGGYGTANSNAYYNGTSTTYGTQVVPYTTQQRRYDQNAVYLVKINPKMRFGIVLNDLSPELRAEYQRNTGAIAEVVVEKTPAFYSNILAGDIIISVDGANVKDSQHAQELMAGVPPTAKSSELTVIRQGEEKKVIVQF